MINYTKLSMHRKDSIKKIIIYKVTTKRTSTSQEGLWCSLIS